MLLPDNVHPENCIYYNGAIVLQVLQNNNKIGLIDLYQKINQVQKMAFPVLILCLDWLYLIDAAEFVEEKVELCF